MFLTLTLTLTRRLSRQERDVGGVERGGIGTLYVVICVTRDSQKSKRWIGAYTRVRVWHNNHVNKFNRYIMEVWCKSIDLGIFNQFQFFRVLWIWGNKWWAHLQNVSPFAQCRIAHAFLHGEWRFCHLRLREWRMLNIFSRTVNKQVKQTKSSAVAVTADRTAEDVRYN